MSSFLAPTRRGLLRLWRAACLECAHGWLCHRFCNLDLTTQLMFRQTLRLGISRQLIPPIVGPLPVSSLCRQSISTQTAVFATTSTRLRRPGNIPFPCYFPNDFLTSTADQY